MVSLWASRCRLARADSPRLVDARPGRRHLLAVAALLVEYLLDVRHVQLARALTAAWPRCCSHRWAWSVVSVRMVVAAAGWWKPGSKRGRRLRMDQAAAAAGLREARDSAATPLERVADSRPCRAAGNPGGFGGGASGALTFAGPNWNPDPGLVSYLEANQGSATYLVATTSSSYASLFILDSAQPAMALGGYQGWDRILTPTEHPRSSPMVTCASSICRGTGWWGPGRVRCQSGRHTRPGDVGRDAL